MVKCLMLSHDGYADWTVDDEEFIDLETFTTQGIHDYLMGVGHYDPGDRLLVGATVGVKHNSISVMYEEHGYTFVKL